MAGAGARTGTVLSFTTQKECLPGADSVADDDSFSQPSDVTDDVEDGTDNGEASVSDQEEQLSEIPSGFSHVDVPSDSTDEAEDAML